MIAVIADDFTGAAELGGIGLRYGLQVEVSTEVNTNSTADLLVIDADSRSVKEAAAIQKIEMITKELKKLKPEWIYKKTDSVLRGHIVAELQAQMKLMGIDRALLVPANPNLGRTIRNGVYFFNDQPIHESGFSVDPEFAIVSSDVRDMLKAAVSVRKPGELLLEDGIIVGEAKEMTDLDYWAAQCTKDILPAGAAGFFSAILDSRKIVKDRTEQVQPTGKPCLYICGTSFERSTTAIKRIFADSGPVSYMQQDLSAWVTQVISMLNTYEKAIMAIDPDITQPNAVELRRKMALAVKEVLQHMPIRELLIEGGSTARAIFDEMNFTRFFPVQELSAGVVKMKVKEQEGIFITVKPGSYAWPPGTWKF